MLDLSRHPYFEEFVDEKTGVKSYILRKRVAELQMPLYFTEMGITYDSKYMWFKCLNWPAEFAYLGVVSLDPDNPFIRSFPGAGLAHGEPNIIPGTHDAIFAVGTVVYRIDVEGNITKVLEVDEDFVDNRRFQGMSTHLSFNSTGELVILDMRISGKTYIATGNVHTGEVKHLHKFNRRYNHAQFSPVDPELFLIDQDWERDFHTGERFDIDQRMWLMDTNCTRLEPVLPGNWFRHNNSIICHDFWSQDGYVCWPDLLDTVCEHNVETRETTVVWNHAICHAHTLNREYWVGDDSPYDWINRFCRVVFFDRASGKEIDIFSAMPKRRYKSTNLYHMDPHPAFTRDGKYITSMTTVMNGDIDVAITPVEPLIKLCRENGTQVNQPSEI